jgi:peptidoglycan/xylan/chitin deacetylase (PgdA/CDA1 family)
MGLIASVGKHILQEYLLPGSFEWRLRGGALTALTFDDGPHPEYTPQVLSVLRAHRVRATFFVVGRAAERFPDVARSIVADGHSIGSHTHTHRELPGLTAQDLAGELAAARAAIAAVTGVDTRLLRPPRGRVDALSLWRLRATGYRLVHWSKTYSDYLQDGTAPLVQRMRIARLAPRDIALLHDTNPYTVAALHAMLPEWRAAGLQFTSL